MIRLPTRHERLSTRPTGASTGIRAHVAVGASPSPVTRPSKADDSAVLRAKRDLVSAIEKKFDAVEHTIS